MKFPPYKIPSQPIKGMGQNFEFCIFPSHLPLNLLLPSLFILSPWTPPTLHNDLMVLHIKLYHSLHNYLMILSLRFFKLHSSQWLVRIPWKNGIEIVCKFDMKFRKHKKKKITVNFIIMLIQSCYMSMKETMIQCNNRQN